MEPDERVHLYRGAPGVRNWSRYPQTVTSWTLCGMKARSRTLWRATEDPGLVTCPFCLDLVQPASYDRPARSGKGVVRVEKRAWDRFGSVG
jgi:hypothetical protein